MKIHYGSSLLFTQFHDYFRVWLVESVDFSVACGIRVFSGLTPMMSQQRTTAFSETEACEEERFRSADFVEWLKPPSNFSIFSSSLIRVWKHHLRRNGNVPWEFLLWKTQLLILAGLEELHPKANVSVHQQHRSVAGQPTREGPSARHLQPCSQAVPGKIITRGKQIQPGTKTRAL